MRWTLMLLLFTLVITQGCTSGSQNSFLSKAGEGENPNLEEIEFDYSPEAFEAALKSGKPTILDFSTDWCISCRYMAPIIKEVKIERGKEVNILTVNGDKELELVREYGVRGYPTFILFDREGNYKTTIVGAMSKRDLNKIIDELVNQ